MRRIVPAQLWQRFRRDTRGVALVEFAMALPVMLVAYCGTVDVVQMVMADRKISQLASTLADLTARVPSVTTGDVSNIFDAAKTVLMPFSTDNAKMMIASVVIDASGIARVCWSSAPTGQQALARGTVVTLPDSVRVPSTSVIMARATYDFTPMTGYVVTGTFTLGDDPIYARPRGAQASGTASIEQVLRTDVAGCPTF